jgi:uncharacterized protein
MYTKNRFDGAGSGVMALPSMHLSEIPDEGLSLTCEVQPEELTLGPEDARVGGGLSLSVEITKGGDGVSVAGLLGGTFVRQCVRCLNEFEDAARLSFAVEYRREEIEARSSEPRGRAERPSGPVANELPERDESLENVYALTGDRLELAEMLREQVILAEPMRPLCHEDCRGLCPVCGQNRNERECGCPEERPDSPFMILKHKMQARGKGL